MSLLYISQQLTIYGGFFLLFTGVIGNLINIFIFSNQKNTHRAALSFLFLIGSIDNLIYLLHNLTIRILTAGFAFDFVNRYLFVCKMRAYVVISLSHISFTCYSISSINQFLSTSRHVKFRQLSHIKWTRWILFILILIFICHSIPELVYTNISSSSGTCGYTNSNYSNYATVSFFVFHFGLPILILIIFGYLSYRNIHQVRALTNQQADRQLTKMTIMQAILICISLTPYGIFFSYSYATIGIIKSFDQRMQEYLIATIISLMSYIHFSGSFYIFFFSSKRFRRTVVNQILFCKKNNEIHPLDVRQT